MESFRCLIVDIPQQMLADIVRRLAEKNEGIKIIDQLQGADGLIDIIKKKKSMF
ncbi:hypothetical protein MNBD_GAMMA09-3161 [hydrothermal vent metagenome]|uniref:Uncharacterized protein n=1 Tax=hydrothermal vent metagenome TaxID=652676 RepID=A0A3B0XJL2_9ZZZZ